MHVLAEAGVTWKQLRETLTSLAWDQPALALSPAPEPQWEADSAQGALFFGSAR